MELPIQIIVVFFVALVVGGAILAFSKNTLDNAQTDLNDRFRNDPANKDIIVDIESGDDNAILNLANSCVEQNKGTVDSKVCFAVFAQQFPADWADLDGKQLSSNFTLDTSAIQSTPNAVKITYSPTGKIIVS